MITFNYGQGIFMRFPFNNNGKRRAGTMSDPKGGEPDYMKGKKYTLKACAIFVLKDNKIVKETDYFDHVAFLRQVGFFDQNH
jgi:hypothetical protein